MIYWFILFEKQRDRALPTAGSLPRCNSQWPGWSHESRTHSGSPSWVLDASCHLPGWNAGWPTGSRHEHPGSGFKCVSCTALSVVAVSVTTVFWWWHFTSSSEGLFSLPVYERIILNDSSTCIQTYSRVSQLWLQGSRVAQSAQAEGVRAVTSAFHSCSFFLAVFQCFSFIVEFPFGALLSPF